MNCFKDKVEGYKKLYLEKDVTVLTNFLSLTEQAILKNSLTHSVDFSFSGGFNNPELKRAVIGNTLKPSFKISCYKITSKNKALVLTHQNIMGSLLSLGLEKIVLGDILANENIFFIKEELKDFIELNFTEIANSKITLTKIDGSDFVRVYNFAITKHFIASLRLDLVISKIAGISRSEASLMIKNGLVKVNHIDVISPTKKVSINDVLSVRKSGRFLLIDDLGQTKKGNIILKVGKYV
ncbi:MAG: YlmH/Sll1252 family protein [Candidatus Izemoplasma sp.]